VRVTDRLLPARVFRRLCPELDQGGRTRHGTPVYVQILGGQPAVVADNAARAAALGAPGIDLNFGCPAKTVNRSDGGAVLLREPQRVHDIAAATRRALPATVPLSVKVRLGFEDRSAFAEVIDAITAAGASEIVVHARTRRDGYRPPAYWSEIRRVRPRTPLPLIANGEIWSPADAQRCREESGSRDLMLGRGTLCRPDLPRLVRGLDQGEPVSPLRWDQVQPLLQHFFEVTLERHGPRHAGNPLKQWLVYLKVYYLEAALLFEHIKRLRDVDSLRKALSWDLRHDTAA
jgi:tRNA-dihydrouridine synthase C